MARWHTYVVIVLSAAVGLSSAVAKAGERFVARDAEGKRAFTLEQGMSGHYSVRDAKGQRIGTGYKRMDGSIAIFDRQQRKIGTLSAPKH